MRSVTKISHVWKFSNPRKVLSQYSLCWLFDMINSEFTVAMDDSVLHFVPSNYASILTKRLVKTRSLSDIGTVLLTLPPLSINDASSTVSGTILNSKTVQNPISSVIVPTLGGIIEPLKIYQKTHGASNLLQHRTSHYTKTHMSNNMYVPNSSCVLTNPQALAIINPQIYTNQHSPQSIKLLNNFSQADNLPASLQTSANPNVSDSKTDSSQNIDSACLKSEVQAASPAITIASLVFFDLETTGLAFEIGKSNVQITEVSMIAIDRKEFDQSTYDDLGDIRIIQKLCFCIRPRSAISPGATAITGLNNNNLADQQPFEQKAAELINSFLSHLPKPVCLLAHNGKRFDFPLLKAEFARLAASLPSDIFIADTLEVFRIFGVPVFPPEKKISPFVKYTKKGQVSCALANLHLYFFNKHPPGSHSSEGDCIALAKVCHKMKDLILPWIDENCSTFDSITPMW